MKASVLLGSFSVPSYDGIAEERFFLLLAAGVLSYAQGLAGIFEMKIRSLSGVSRGT